MGVFSSAKRTAKKVWKIAGWMIDTVSDKRLRTPLLHTRVRGRMLRGWLERRARSQGFEGLKWDDGVLSGVKTMIAPPSTGMRDARTGKFHSPR